MKKPSGADGVVRCKEGRLLDCDGNTATLAGPYREQLQAQRQWRLISKLGLYE